MGQTRQKGSFMLLVMPECSTSCPVLGSVPGISSAPKIEYEPKITLRIKNMAMITYLDWCKAVLVLGEKLRWRFLKTFRTRVSRSM